MEPAYIILTCVFSISIVLLLIPMIKWIIEANTLRKQKEAAREDENWKLASATHFLKHEYKGYSIYIFAAPDFVKTGMITADIKYKDGLAVTLAKPFSKVITIQTYKYDGLSKEHISIEERINEEMSLWLTELCCMIDFFNQISNIEKENTVKSVMDTMRLNKEITVKYCDLGNSN